MRMVKSSSCFSDHWRTEEMIESAAIAGDSSRVLVSRSHNASSPKKSPATLEASTTPSVYITIRSSVSSLWTAVEYDAKSNAASIKPFSSIWVTRPFLTSNRGGCAAAEYRSSPDSEFRWTYAAVTKWSCVLPNKAEFMPVRNWHGSAASARCEAAASLTIDAMRAAGTPCPDTSAINNPTWWSSAMM